MSRILPAPVDRAHFLSIVVGMAKEYGYTDLDELLRDVRVSWPHVPETTVTWVGPKCDCGAKSMMLREHARWCLVQPPSIREPELERLEKERG